jgi:hypothetical protein
MTQLTVATLVDISVSSVGIEMFTIDTSSRDIAQPIIITPKIRHLCAYMNSAGGLRRTSVSGSAVALTS